MAHAGHNSSNRATLVSLACWSALTLYFAGNFIDSTWDLAFHSGEWEGQMKVATNMQHSTFNDAIDGIHERLGLLSKMKQDAFWVGIFGTGMILSGLHVRHLYSRL